MNILAQVQTIGVITRPDTPDIAPELETLVFFLRGQGKQVLIDCEALEQEQVSPTLLAQTGNQFANKEYLGQYCQLIMVLGGDGTFLSAARIVAPYGVPLIGVNLGHLGFLVQVSRESMLVELSAMLSGEYVVDECILLEASVWREDKMIYHSLALNDVMLSRGLAGKMIEFEVFVNQQFVYSQRSDGLIVSTPTGSTAYALAAGGPILQTGLRAFTLVPVCPQSMTNRPIVISDDGEIEILVTKAGDARVHYDGQAYVDVQTHDQIRLRRYHQPIRIIHPKHYQYYKTLRQKLHWGEQLFNA